MFTPVDPAIKEKVISAYLAGHGRNQITRELHEQGIKVSHGSISNFINAYKRKHEQPRPSPNDVSAGITTGVSLNIGASSPLLNGIGKAATIVNSNSDLVTVEGNEGGPLSYFLPSGMDTTKNVNVNTNSNSTSIITDKEPYLDMIQQYDEPIDFADTPYPESDVYTDPNADCDERYYNDRPFTANQYRNISSNPTGAAYSTRTLYTTADETLFKFR